MSAYKPYENYFLSQQNFCNQPEIVALDVEHIAFVSNIIHAVEIVSDVIKRVPIGDFGGFVPGFKRCSGIGVHLIKTPNRGHRNNSHYQSFQQIYNDYSKY